MVVSGGTVCRVAPPRGRYLQRSESGLPFQLRGVLLYSDLVRVARRPVGSYQGRTPRRFEHPRRICHAQLGGVALFAQRTG
jgi:hypothetical protein